MYSTTQRETGGKVVVVVVVLVVVVAVGIHRKLHGEPDMGTERENGGLRGG